MAPSTRVIQPIQWIHTIKYKHTHTHTLTFGWEKGRGYGSGGLRGVSGGRDEVTQRGQRWRQPHPHPVIRQHLFIKIALLLISQDMKNMFRSICDRTAGNNSIETLTKLNIVIRKTPAMELRRWMRQPHFFSHGRTKPASLVNCQSDSRTSPVVALAHSAPAFICARWLNTFQDEEGNEQSWTGLVTCVIEKGTLQLWSYCFMFSIYRKYWCLSSRL